MKFEFAPAKSASNKVKRSEVSWALRMKGQQVLYWPVMTDVGPLYAKGNTYEIKIKKFEKIHIRQESFARPRA